MADGTIIILNGAPRSGKSSIAQAIQERFDGVWVNLGVDNAMRTLPEGARPGIGLRPGGERPDLEPLVVALYEALYGSIAAHSRLGLRVVADLGHHDMYSRPLRILPRCARILAGLPVLFVGVDCPLDVILARREATGYPARTPQGDVQPAVLRWQEAVHAHGRYDLRVNTGALSAEACAARIGERLALSPRGEAFAALAEEAD